jgi:hypothetical protein
MSALAVPVANDMRVAFHHSPKCRRLAELTNLLPDERSVNAFTTYLDCRKGLSAETDAILLNPLGNRISTQSIARVIAKTADRRYALHLTPTCCGILFPRCFCDLGRVFVLSRRFSDMPPLPQPSATLMSRRNTCCRLFGRSIQATIWPLIY